MYRHVLVPVDPEHGKVGPRIVALARLLAGGHGRVTLLTVVPPLPSHVAVHVGPEVTERSLAAARSQLEALARDTGLDPAGVLVREGGPGNTILSEARTIGVDAIVLGSHRPDITDYLLGSTAARVVRHAPCTVVVERSGSA
jgi:nucleotide-binding universal stress UspA family protein